MYKNKNMKIDDNQMYLINHYTQVVGSIAEEIDSLCSCERDDIVYGYRLGKIHEELRRAQIEISSVLDLIKYAPQPVADSSTEAP